MDENGLRLEAKVADLQNTGLPITTAMLMAYELMRERVNGSPELTPEDIAKNIGNLAGHILEKVKKLRGDVPTGPDARAEPDDPHPGCRENGGGACELGEP